MPAVGPGEERRLLGRVRPQRATSERRRGGSLRRLWSRCGGTHVAALAAALLLLPALARAAQPFACGTLSGAAAAQCAALGELYIALNGSSWRIREGWAQAAGSGQVPDVCAFFGVTCDASGAVTQLCVPRRAGVPAPWNVGPARVAAPRAWVGPAR